MANVTITIGSPSLTGKDGVALVQEAFSASSFPLSATIANFLPRPDEYAQAGGFAVGHVADLKNSTATVSFESLDDLKDFASEVAQISELNGFEKAVTVTAEGTEPAGEEDEESDDEEGSEPAVTTEPESAQGKGEPESEPVAEQSEAAPAAQDQAQTVSVAKARAKKVAAAA